MPFFAAASIPDNMDLLQSASDPESGVSEPSGDLKDVIVEIEGGSGPRSGVGVRPNTYDSIEGALERYEAGVLLPAGEGRNRGYALSVGLGIAGLLSVATGGVLLAKGRPVLGSIGVGAGAGCGVGSYFAYPSVVKMVGYNLRVGEDRYVFIRVPEGLTPEMFLKCSHEQASHLTDTEQFIIPTVILYEESEARRDHADELKANAPMTTSSSSSSSSSDDPLVSSASSSASSSDDEEEEEDVLAKKEAGQPVVKVAEPSAPVEKKGLSPESVAAITPMSSKSKHASTAGSGIVVL